LVERQERFPEPQMLLSALAADKRVRVHVAWLRGKAELTQDQRGLFQFDQQPYDVIILGDVTAARLLEADKDALVTIAERGAEKRGEEGGGGGVGKGGGGGTAGGGNHAGAPEPPRHARHGGRDEADRRGAEVRAAPGGPGGGQPAAVGEGAGEGPAQRHQRP